MPHVDRTRPNVPGVPGLPLPPRPPGAPWYAHWSPGAVAAGVVAVIVALGGATGVREILGSSEATRVAVREAEERIKATLIAELQHEREARQELSAEVVRLEERVEYVAGFAVALNKGKAHPTIPADSFGGRPKPLGEADTPPFVLTDTPWPGDK